MLSLVFPVVTLEFLLSPFYGDGLWLFGHFAMIAGVAAGIGSAARRRPLQSPASGARNRHRTPNTPGRSLRSSNENPKRLPKTTPHPLESLDCDLIITIEALRLTRRNHDSMINTAFEIDRRKSDSTRAASITRRQSGVTMSTERSQ